VRFSYSDAHGTEFAAVTLEHLWHHTFALHREIPDLGGLTAGASTWREPVVEAIAAARSESAQEIVVRVTETGDWADYLALLSEFGFEKRSDRVEYRAPVDQLPDDAGTPLQWVPLEPLGAWSVEDAAELIGEVAVGDPDFDPSEDTLGLLKGYLADPVLTTGPDCVHIGYLMGQPVAIVIAQVNPKSGWSRITYMGIDPALREKGLGKYVHRHGFVMMREQGGVTYHGGTLQGNTAMRKLFEKHGCEEYRRLQEWSLRLQ
jgi:ribosomal protein S18 acetylase RimI-like enzyme